MSNASSCSQILVVEDEADIRDTIQQILEYEGFRVRTARNGQEGLDVLKQIDQPCLILLDLMMPVMNGWEFVSALGTGPSRPQSPIVLVTAAAENAQSIGAEGLLRKPVDLDQLVSVAEAYCQRIPQAPQAQGPQ